MAPINSNVGAAWMMATAPRDAGSLARPNTLGEQALYAATVRRFLDMSRVYLALNYIGSRRWYPSSGVFSMPSAGYPDPDSQLSRQGEKHVVG